jgi:hypothetical protein
VFSIACFVCKNLPQQKEVSYVAEENLMYLRRYKCANPTWSWGLAQYQSLCQKDMASSFSRFILGNLLGLG